MPLAGSLGLCLRKRVGVGGGGGVGSVLVGPLRKRIELVVIKKEMLLLFTLKLLNLLFNYRALVLKVVKCARIFNLIVT